MIRTITTLTCDRETRPPVDGMRTVCGRPFEYYGPATDALHRARAAGWTHTGAGGVYCPAHPINGTPRAAVCAYCGHDAGMHLGGPCHYDGAPAMNSPERHRRCTCTSWTPRG